MQSISKTTQILNVFSFWWMVTYTHTMEDIEFVATPLTLIVELSENSEDEIFPHSFHRRNGHTMQVDMLMIIYW